MLDARRQRYLQLSLAAGVLAVRLDRVGSGEPTKSDAKALETAAKELGSLFDHDRRSETTPSSGVPVFASADGLSATLVAVRPRKIQNVARELQEVAHAVKIGSYRNKKIKQRAEKLRDVFLRLQREADTRLAQRRMGGSTIPKTPMQQYAKAR